MITDVVETGLLPEKPVSDTPHTTELRETVSDVWASFQLLWDTVKSPDLRSAQLPKGFCSTARFFELGSSPHTSRSLHRLPDWLLGIGMQWWRHFWTWFFMFMLHSFHFTNLFFFISTFLSYLLLSLYLSLFLFSIPSFLPSFLLFLSSFLSFLPILHNTKFYKSDIFFLHRTSQNLLPFKIGWKSNVVKFQTFRLVRSGHKNIGGFRWIQDILTNLANNFRNPVIKLSHQSDFDKQLIIVCFKSVS